MSGDRLFVTGRSSKSTVSDVPYWSFDVLTVGYDAMTGDELWTARYDGAAGTDDGSWAIELSPDGNSVYVTGYENHNADQQPGKKDTDAVTIAYDAHTGREKWVAAFDGPAGEYDSGRSLVVSPSGDRVYVVGSQDAFKHWDYVQVTDRSDFLLLAYDAATGELVWHESYDGPVSLIDGARDAALSPDGQVLFVTGVSDSSSDEFDFDWATLAVLASSEDDPSLEGTLLWASRLDGGQVADDVPVDVEVDPQGNNVYVVGSVQGMPSSLPGTGANIDFLTVAYNIWNGDTVWAERFDAPDGGLVDDDIPVGVVSAPGRVIVAGTSGNGQTGCRITTIAYEDETGFQEWIDHHHDPIDNCSSASSMALSGNGSRLIIGGHSSGRVRIDDAKWSDFVVLTFVPSNGAKVHVARFNSSDRFEDWDRSVAVSTDYSGDSVFVTGMLEYGWRAPLVAEPNVRDYGTIAYLPG